MALQFNPPDWVIQEYLNRKTPAQEASIGLQTGLQNYLAIDEAKRRNAIAERELELRRRFEERQGRESFYLYGDPTGLTPEQQSALGPVQGPANQVPVDYRTAQQFQLGTAEGPALPMTEEEDPQFGGSPILKYFRDFHQEYPQGILGKKTDISELSVLSKRQPDQKRTFQLKGFKETPNGMVPVSYDTRSGGLVQGNAIEGGLLPTVAPSIPGSEVSKFGELDNLKDKMKVARDSYDKSFVGMIDAPMQALRQRTGKGATEKAARFRQSVQDLKDSLLRARSGAQINEQEYQRLLPLVPNEYMSEIDFMAKANRFNEVLDETIANKRKAFAGAGYRPMSGEAPQTTAPLFNTGGGLDPARKARLEELRAKKAAGTLRR